MPGLRSDIVNRFLHVGRVRRLAFVGVTAILFVTWWCALTIGTRPESVAACSTVVVLALTCAAVESRRLFLAQAATTVASLALAAHPTGIVALAPLLLSVPAFWKIARERIPSWRAINWLGLGRRSRWICRPIRWFLGRIPERRLDVPGPVYSRRETTDLGNEFARYQMLLEDNAMGTYVKRAVVLVSLTALIWFIALWIWDRSRGLGTVSRSAALRGWSFGLGFILIWITTVGAG